MSDHACDSAHGCITCGDTAVEMRVLRVDDERELALCADEAGNRSSVEIALVKPVGRGDGLLVHAGTALGRAAEHHPSADPGTPGREAEEVPG